MLVLSVEKYENHLYNEIKREFGFDFRASCKKGSLSQWPDGLRRRSVAARLLSSFYLNPTGGRDVCLL